MVMAFDGETADNDDCNDCIRRPYLLEGNALSDATVQWAAGIEGGTSAKCFGRWWQCESQTYLLYLFFVSFIISVIFQPFIHALDYERNRAILRWGLAGR